jgi:hypothetical protein
VRTRRKARESEMRRKARCVVRVWLDMVAAPRVGVGGYRRGVDLWRGF